MTSDHLQLKNAHRDPVRGRGLPSESKFDDGARCEFSGDSAGDGDQASTVGTINDGTSKNMGLAVIGFDGDINDVVGDVHFVIDWRNNAVVSHESLKLESKLGPHLNLVEVVDDVGIWHGGIP